MSLPTSALVILRRAEALRGTLRRCEPAKQWKGPMLHAPSDSAPSASMLSSDVRSFRSAAPAFRMTTVESRSVANKQVSINLPIFLVLSKYGSDLHQVIHLRQVQRACC